MKHKVTLEFDTSNPNDRLRLEMEVSPEQLDTLWELEQQLDNSGWETGLSSLQMTVRESR